MKISFLFLAIFSGLLTALSFDFPQLSFLIWFSLVPFLYLIAGSNLKQGVIYAFTFGLTHYTAVLFWVGNVTVLGLIFLLVYLSCYPVLFFLLGRSFLKRPFALITLPCLWVMLEVLKESIWCGFGWANLGYSQFMNLYFIQVADLGGVKLISFMIVMVNILILEIISTFKIGILSNRKILKKSAVVFLVLLFCFCYSALRLNTLKDYDYVRVSLVQPDIAEEEKYKQQAVRVIERLKVLTQATDEDSLVIFPEAAWPFVVDNGDEQLNDFIGFIKRDVLIGVVRKKDRNFYNAALLFNKQAELLDTYNKIKLVPFGEYVPLREFLSFIPVLNYLGDMTRGSEYVVFPFKNKMFSVLICFEDIFPGFVSYCSRGRNFLVNITNDAWFRGEPEASQHLSIMTFRAIENRIPIVRAANTGISGWVGFNGEIHKLVNNGKEVFFEDTMNFILPLNRSRSLYNRFGYIFPLLCGFILLISSFIFRKIKQ